MIAIGPENGEVRYLVVSLLTILSNVMLLILIFAPKLYKLMSEDRNVRWPHDNVDLQSRQDGERDSLTVRESNKINSVFKSLDTMDTNMVGFDNDDE